MTGINNLKGRFYVQETHIRMRDGGKTTRKNGVVYTPAECMFGSRATFPGSRRGHENP